MKEMILYCNVGYMNYYQGLKNDSLTGGGSYNKDNIGSELYNFLDCNGSFYGFVEPGSYNGKQKRIHLESFGAKPNDESVSGILVIWVARRQIVGWYHDATVFAIKQMLTDEILKVRNSDAHTEYNVTASNAVLVPPELRSFQIKGMGQCQHWFGNEEVNKAVITYIEQFEETQIQAVNKLEDISLITGDEVLALVKQRINQDKFRKKLLGKYNSCCICGVTRVECLIASHIKPWRDCNREEKTDVNNGLLLCPNHDKLFDLGFISFDEEGKLLISDQLDDNNRMFLNAHPTMHIQITDKNKFYLAYHRTHIFK